MASPGTGKHTIEIEWAAPAPIEYGEALGAAQLNAKAMCHGAEAAGTMTYHPPAGTLLNAGTTTLTVMFTPKDPALHSVAKGQCSLTVTKGKPQISWRTVHAPYGTPLSSAELNASASYLGKPVAGNFVYTPAAGAVLKVGSHALSCTFAPDDSTNLDSIDGSTTCNVEEVYRLRITCVDSETQKTFSGAGFDFYATDGRPLSPKLADGLHWFNGAQTVKVVPQKSRRSDCECDTLVAQLPEVWAHVSCGTNCLRMVYDRKHEITATVCVRDEHRKPVGGVGILVWPAEPLPSGRGETMIETAVTNACGVGLIPGLECGVAYHFAAIAPAGFENYRVLPNAIVTCTASEAEICFTLSETVETYTWIFLQDGFEALANCKLEFCGVSGGRQSAYTSDQNGLMKVILRPGGYSVTSSSHPDLTFPNVHIDHGLNALMLKANASQNLIVFSGEIRNTVGAISPGAPYQVVDSSGRQIAAGQADAGGIYYAEVPLNRLLGASIVTEGQQVPLTEGAEDVAPIDAVAEVTEDFAGTPALAMTVGGKLSGVAAERS